MDQTYRKERIDTIMNQLNTDLSEAEKQYKTHRSKGACLEKTEYALTATTMLTGITVLSSLASTPVGIAFGALAGVCGIADIIVKTIHKKNTIKTQKWQDVAELIQDTHSDMEILISKTLDDNRITDSELEEVVETFTNYRDKLTTLRNKYLTREENIKLNK